MMLGALRVRHPLLPDASSSVSSILRAYTTTAAAKGGAEEDEQIFRIFFILAYAGNPFWNEVLGENKNILDIWYLD